MRPVDGVSADTPRTDVNGMLRDALSLLLSVKSDSALVLDAQGAAVGTLRLEDIHAAAAAE